MTNGGFSAAGAPTGETSAYGRADLDSRRLRPRRTVEALARGYVENDIILTNASAISFQVFFALIPLGLSALGGGTGTSNP